MDGIATEKTVEPIPRTVDQVSRVVAEIKRKGLGYPRRAIFWRSWVYLVEMILNSTDTKI